MCLGWAGLHGAWAQSTATTPVPLVLEVSVNGQPEIPTRPVLRVGDRLLFSGSDLQAWRIVRPPRAAAQVDGVDYYDLGAIPEGTTVLEESTQTVRVHLPLSAFQQSRLSAPRNAMPVPSEAAFGAFLNYDLALEHSSTGTRAAGLVDAAVSDRWGLAASSFLLGRSAFGGNRGGTRLDTYFRQDDPVKMTRLTVGDSITQSASWSTPLYFGGVQFGTQFGLRPGYITYPTPSLSGGSAVPSTIEAYVNDTLRYQGRVDAGPFALDSVPVLTGAGEMRFAVRDALGVQRSVSTPYYVSSALLRPGLSAYSVEFGWNRRDYGLASFNYGRPFTAGTWRHGLSESATVELHGEANSKSQTAGAGLSWVWTPVGEFGLHGAASNGDAGRGTLWRASFAHLAPDWSFSASRQVASRNFMQVAWQETTSHVLKQDQLFAGRSLGRFGSVGTAYTALRYSTGDAVRVLSLNWSIAVASNAYLGTYIARSQTGSGRTTTAGLTLTVTLGERRSGSFTAQQQNGRASFVADVAETAPPDHGQGWRVQAARGDVDRTQGEWTWRAPWGTVGAQAVDLQGVTSARLLASGAFGYAGGMGFASQRSGDAFALVTVPGAPGIQVYRENQPVATTDAQGRAIVPGLRAWEANRISIDNADLPIAAQVGGEVLQVVPRAKGVAAARFDISLAQSATVTVRLPDGQPLPPGIDVSGEGRPAALISGYGGTLLVDRPRAGERFEARWRGGQCRFTVRDIPPGIALPQLGPYTCETITEPPGR